jgi:Tol biopolymer transport system component
VLDLARHTTSRLTSDEFADAGPVWSPTGTEIVFRSNRSSSSLEVFRTQSHPGASADLIFGQEQQRLAQDHQCQCRPD